MCDSGHTGQCPGDGGCYGREENESTWETSDRRVDWHEHWLEPVGMWEKRETRTTLNILEGWVLPFTERQLVRLHDHRFCKAVCWEQNSGDTLHVNLEDFQRWHITWTKCTLCMIRIGEHEIHTQKKSVKVLDSNTEVFQNQALPCSVSRKMFLWILPIM